MNSDMFVRRPKPGEDEDDIIALQAQWNKQNELKTSVNIKKFTKSKNISPGVSSKPPSSTSKPGPARFTIDLEKIVEENPLPVVFDVKEQNQDWFTQDRSEDILKQGLERLKYSKEEGFPDIIDLSAYFTDGPERRVGSSQKSFFATEFDRLHGIIEDSTVPFVPTEEPESDQEESPYASNDAYIESLSIDKVKELRKDIEDRLDGKMIEFLKSRYKTKADKPKPKVSKFKQSMLDKVRSQNACSVDQQNFGKPEKETDIKEHNMENLESQPSSLNENTISDDLVKQLEVLDEFADRADEEKYNRLATDAVQIDFATKCLRTMLPRQQQNAVKLFDNLKNVPMDYVPNKIVDRARERIDDIKHLYLEDISIDGKIQTQFTAGSNPLIDSCWPLRPIRSVLDALQKRDANILTDDDLDIVQLSLMWTVLLFRERPTAFYSFAEPNEMYVRLAECFLLGDRLLEHDDSMECISMLFESYILKCAFEGRICLRMNARIADLDAFMPFYEDLLKHFESYSMGNKLFSQFILVGSYLNSGRSDSLECRFAIWSPKLNVARQMTVSVEDSEKIMNAIRSQRDEQMEIFEDQNYISYCSLLGVYTAALRDKKITRERNPLMFTIAAEELGKFVKKHTMEAALLPEKNQEFGNLVEIIVGSLKDIVCF